jgi:hypothetical protein
VLILSLLVSASALSALGPVVTWFLLSPSKDPEKSRQWFFCGYILNYIVKHWVTVYDRRILYTLLAVDLCVLEGYKSGCIKYVAFCFFFFLHNRQAF